MRQIANKSRTRVFVVWTICISLTLQGSAIAGDGPFGFITWERRTQVEQLASRIDEMERNLDEYGSVVIKTPDVWGESRLMRHRADVETQLRARLNGFNFRINAVQATRDAAFLATAIAIQEQIAAGAAATATTPAITGDVGALTGAAPTGTNVNNVNAATSGMIGNPTGNSDSFLVPRSKWGGFLANVDGKTPAQLSVGIEPVIELDQLNRYLQHLNELRRLNEGDDNTDTPGYALNLIRIPVSVLPGRKTQEGFGAEVQLTIDPYISEEILPVAFKDFVINGVLDRIALDVLQIAQAAKLEELNEFSQLPKSESNTTKPPKTDASSQGTELTPSPVPLVPPERTGVFRENAPSSRAFLVSYLDDRKTYSLQELLSGRPLGKLHEFREELKSIEDDSGEELNKAAIRVFQLPESEVTIVDEKGNQASKQVTVEAISQFERIAQLSRLANINHRGQAVSPSHRTSINGTTLGRVANFVYSSLVASGWNEDEEVHSDERFEHGLTMPATETLLREELISAYRFLSEPSLMPLWTEFCTPDLARRAREHRRTNPLGSVPTVDSLQLHRERFFERVSQTIPEARHSVTDALAWQIIVESALLNEQLIKDMRETASLKNCQCIPQEWTEFFGPNPPVEARYAFREYVRCKWPIHVFALDPVTQDQNIADSFSQRREMQMSLAIAAANQGMGGQALSRFVRRLEYDLETIELNRTAVGFSHGDNTFGWQFFPRVQTPPIPSNLRATVGDLLIGGQNRNDLLRTRRLEPGIRECTALVVMPSFVPQVTVDVRTTWFRLAKHTPLLKFMARKPGYENSMELSREVVELKRLQQQCLSDAHLYRDGEVFRLCKAVERLDRRLPLQTHHVSVPWENALGGFEVVQSGAKVLGPELHGWYGAPGIVLTDVQASRNAAILLTDAQRKLLDEQLKLAIEKANTPLDQTKVDSLTASVGVLETKVTEARELVQKLDLANTSTAVYLVGKNFSVLNCRVMAGGVDITNTIEVINRNLMQVRIPSYVSPVSTGHVAVHVASPYGATSRLLVKVAGTSELSTAAEALETAKAAKRTADEAASKLNATISAATSATDAVKATTRVISSRMPVSVAWDEKDDEKTFCVKVSQHTNGLIQAYHFCPVKDGSTPIPVVEAKKSTPWADPKGENVNGQLALYVSFQDTTQRKVGPWKIKDGQIFDLNPPALVGDLTAENLLHKILEEVKTEIDCSKDEPVNIKVDGYIKFNDGQPVVHIDRNITYELKTKKKE